MVRKHDAPGADANRLRPPGDVSDCHGSRGARDARHVVMLREPKAMVVPLFGVLRQVKAVAQGLQRIGAFRNKCKTQNRQAWRSEEHTSETQSLMLIS